MKILLFILRVNTNTKAFEYANSPGRDLLLVFID